MAKPSEQLEWCNLNPIDGTSLQPAIITPSAGKLDSGLLRKEKPVRQDTNWFRNLAGLWQTYFETETDLNNTHRSSNGTDHSDVILNNTHRASNGTNHSDVVLNNAHRVSDGKNHSDVVLNNTHRAVVTGNPHNVLASQISDFAVGVRTASDPDGTSNNITPGTGTISISLGEATTSKIGSGTGRTIFVEFFITLTQDTGTNNEYTIDMADTLNSLPNLQGSGPCMLIIGATREIGIFDTTGTGAQITIQRLDGSDFPLATTINISGTFIGRNFA